MYFFTFSLLNSHFATIDDVESLGQAFQRRGATLQQLASEGVHIHCRGCALGYCYSIGIVKLQRNGLLLVGNPGCYLIPRSQSYSIYVNLMKAVGEGLADVRLKCCTLKRRCSL